MFAMFITCMCFSYLVDKLQHFMEVSKLQVVKEKSKTECGDMVELEDEAVQITSVEFQTTSRGRERFGVGTKERPKYDLDEEQVQKFYMLLYTNCLNLLFLSTLIPYL